MFEKFDRALERALSSERTAFGTGDRRLALATARRAAAENRIKALNEATLGHAKFAAIHENASTRFHEDAEQIALENAPLHHSLSFYLTTAETYARVDRTLAAETDTSANVIPLRRTRRAASAA